ncbi:heavy metal-binding domain-containing protein [Glaesserella parasuis]|uniref:heavy metal-binding domain-containing protein n=1 Tax=Glaesserella parasuis TaxID=738 RepID=UPI001A9487F1|nr:heavy metal-binding domain-containing protein [Glaesserella parasuis]MDO9931963.1 heavy metal-binding domain-containing protein [Glaesserella parasuis]MDP0021163.1 heavy metal-binding domain-containing protein [Glaesserella parasuis]MDP0033921.1 heavy metal-binding domain-containing protein [Glaesserella parasuis]QSX10501.1 heavy metal-binding domain-containing protein [Glaesserella parasuis]
MIISTTSNIENHQIVEYKGLVFGEVVSDANAVVGVSMEYQSMGGDKGMFIVVAIGTAVVIR